MSETIDEYVKLLDQLNEEFAESLSLVGLEPDAVKEWGCSCTLMLDEYKQVLGQPKQLLTNVRGMPVWHFYDSEGILDLYIVQLTLPGMEHLTLSFNAREPIEGKMLEVFQSIVSKIS